MQLKWETGAKQVSVEKGLERNSMYQVAACIRRQALGWLSSWGHWRQWGDTRVVCLPSEAPAANMSDTCHSAPVCCALFHSDTLPGIERSSMCRKPLWAAAWAVLLSTPRQVRAGAQRAAAQRAVTGPLPAGHSQL